MLFDYDLKEHVIILVDWTENAFQSIYGGYMHSGIYPSAFSILINGKGHFGNNISAHVPLETFKVDKGYKYRFRLINSGIRYCFMEFSIDSHNLTIIEVDGNPIEPTEVESIVLNNGCPFF